jgi:ribonucleoside-diphosphate reductase alpha chain
MFKRTTARSVFKDMLMSLQTTSHPWLTWKDTINNRALNNNTGTIHLSNLCTEICLPQDIDNIAVCNLASINLSRHLQDDGTFNWATIERSARLAVRQLDNLIDITMSSVPEADNANINNRAVGLGIMGFTDVVERLGYSYESEEAYELIDEVAERISYYAIQESVDLAAERGSYPNFDGSRWSQGMVPFDTIAITEQDRGVEIKVNRKTRMDWDSLRERVKGGMRNATLMAIAPTASIGLVAGTTPGFDPQFSQIFSRSTSNGKFLEVNRNLVRSLQEHGLWEKVREQVLRSQGDIQGIADIPDEIKAVFKTSFQLSPYAFLEVAARAQKWIDQAISRNIYLETRDIGDMVDLYSAAWERGVKTTYYLHMKPRHQAEQTTVRVNKAEEIGGSRKGFGAVPAGVSAGAGSSDAGSQAPAPAPARRGFGFGSLNGGDK